MIRIYSTSRRTRWTSMMCSYVQSNWYCVTRACWLHSGKKRGWKGEHPKKKSRPTSGEFASAITNAKVSSATAECIDSNKYAPENTCCLVLLWGSWFCQYMLGCKAPHSSFRLTNRKTWLVGLVFYEYAAMGIPDYYKPVLSFLHRTALGCATDM